MSNSAVEIVEADLTNSLHQAAVVEMTNAYCLDPMANGRPLAREVREQLVAGLREHAADYRLILLAFHSDRPVGIATCFRGFSTFSARPLMNVHDLSVIPEYRGRGVGRCLLEAVEVAARQRGCCKMTLEVLEHNPARRLYEAAGFKPAEYNGAAGQALFLTKSL